MTRNSNDEDTTETVAVAVGLSVVPSLTTTSTVRSPRTGSASVFSKVTVWIAVL